jgi:uncharacterized membrane protein YeiH
MVILGKDKPFWTSETEYLYICMAFAGAAFFSHHTLEKQHPQALDATLTWTDTLGLGAFAAIGAKGKKRKRKEKEKKL